MQPLQCRFLGSPEVCYDGHLIAFPTRKTLSLFTYLITEQSTVSRDTLTHLLWPDSDSAHGRAALRQTIARLKALFDTLGAADYAHPLIITRQSIHLNPQATLEVDVWEVDRVLRHLDRCEYATDDQEGTESTQAAEGWNLTEQLQTVIAYYRGDFLAGFSADDTPDFENWVSTQRESWHLRFMRVFEQLAQRQAEYNNLDAAIETTKRWVAHDPLNEIAHRHLMTYLFNAGNRVAAIRAYDACRTVLAKELSIEPEAETEALVEHIRTSKALATTLPAAQPASHSTSNSHTAPDNRPVYLSPLVGRDTDIAYLRQQLSDPKIRLLTLTGPPGVGKTRLAVTVMSDGDDLFADGCTFVDLAPLSDAEFVPAAIVRSLNLHISSEQPLLHVLVEHLRDQHSLLVLDNFEHVLPAADTIAELLAACPHLTVIVTSRERLRLRWEHCFSVAPLTLPNMARIVEPNAIEQAPATQLFVQRARMVYTDFAVMCENAPSIAQLCSQLDGLPLAIKLAAAHAATLSPSAMLTLLNQRLPIPAASLRDLPERRQTICLAISASYALLSQTQQQMFRRLAVLAGDWGIDAAQSVTNVQDCGQELLPTLVTLADKSLLQPKSTSDRDEARFTMLATIRTYGLEQLESNGELIPTQQRHTIYFTELAEQARHQLRGPDQYVWLKRLANDYDNIRAALRWSISNGNAEYGLRLCVALYHFWNCYGLFKEGRDWLKKALANPISPPKLRASALMVAGYMEAHHGNTQQARLLSEEALALSHTLQDSQRIAASLNSLGIIWSAQGETTRATECFEVSLTLQRELGDTRRIAMILNNLGLIALEKLDYNRANALLEEGLRLRQQVDDTQGVAGSLLNLGRVALAQADSPSALTLFAESLKLMQHSQFLSGSIECLEQIAWALSEQRQATLAAQIWGSIDHLRDLYEAPLWPTDTAEHKRYVSKARASLGDNAFRVAWAAGKQWTLEQTIDQALAHVTNSAPHHATFLVQ
jgi:predicted ATPase/DNA-binding SARP family transcriptional activator